MRTSHVATALGAALLLAVALIEADTSQAERPQSEQRVRLSLPLMFEPNEGQEAAPVLFSANAESGRVFLSAGAEAALVFGDPGRSVGVRMRPVSGAASAAVGERRGRGVSSYLRGNDPSRWQSGVAQYGAVRFPQIYPGIDFVFYGNGRKLEYDAVVAPGVDPSAVLLEFDGVETIRVDEKGQLVLGTVVGDVVQPVPVVYQTRVDEVRQLVAGRYVIRESNRVGFEVGDYDRARPLVIDPTLVYGTYFGGSGTESFAGIELDGAGNIYAVGATNSVTFPTVNGLQPASAGDFDIVLAKLNSSGTAVIYSTYIGGSDRDSIGGLMPIAVDSTGNVFVTGWTDSTDFPTVNAYDGTRSTASDPFVFKLDASGTFLVYSTYLGGNGGDVGTAIATDSDGRAYIVGQGSSTDFCVGDASLASFLWVLEPDGLSTTYENCFAGGGSQAFGVAVDANRNAYVVGTTTTPGYPLLNPLQPTYGGNGDGFLTKFDPVGAMVYSTYVGGSGSDSLAAVAVDTSGAAIIGGASGSTDFPTVSPFQSAPGGGSLDGVIARVNPSGTALTFSSYFGGSGTDSTGGVGVDSFGFVYVAGSTNSPDFPTVNALPGGGAGSNSDAVLMRLNPSGTIRTYSTRLGGTGSDSAGGVAVKADGTAYVAGSTSSLDFPTLSAVQGSNAGGSDGFITAVHPLLAPVASDLTVLTNEDTPIGITLTASDPNGVGLQWILLNQPANGTLTGTAPVLTYTPDPDFSGPLDSFQFQVYDGFFYSNVATVTIDVQNDQPPMPIDDYLTTDVDVPLIVDASVLLANDVDPGPLTLMFVEPAQNGTTELDGTQVTYTPNPGFSGSDTFAYVVRNLPGHFGAASVHVTVAKVVGNPDFVDAVEDAPVAIQAAELLANDFDADGDTLLITAVSSPVNGAVSLAGSTITFTPSANFNGAASFSYTVSDGTMTDLTPVSVTVFPVNDPPVGTADTLNATEDTAATITAATLLANDSDIEGDLLTVMAVGPAANGDVSLSGTTVMYTPDADFNGADAFSYVVRDPGGLTAHVAVNVTIAATPDAPRAITESLGMDEDTVASLPSSALTANDVDPDGDSLTVTAVSNAVSGTVSLVSGTVSYSPDPDFSGMGSFTYTVTDGSLFGTGFVLVNVMAVNDGPAPALDVLSTLEDVEIAVSAASLLSNDDDVDWDALSLVSVGGATGGTAVLNAGTITFTPDPGFRGQAAFTYDVSDGTLTSTGDVTVFVLPVNHAPEAPVSASPGPTVGTLSPTLSVTNAIDPDGDSLELEFAIDIVPTFDSSELQASGLISQSGGATTEWQIPEALVEDTVYFWRVRSNDGFLPSDWELSSFFVSAANDPPSTPTAVSPSDSLVFTRTPTLTILGASDPEGAAITYDFEITDDDGEIVASATGVVPDDDGPTASWTVDPAQDLKKGREYSWRARAADADGLAGEFSLPALFKVFEKPADDTGACSVSSSRGSGAASSMSLLVGLGLVLEARRRKSALVTSKGGS